MLKPGSIYKTRKDLSVDIPAKRVQEDFDNGNMNYIFSTSFTIPKGQAVLILQSKRTTVTQLSKILYDGQIYNYFYNDDYCEEDWELVC